MLVMVAMIIIDISYLCMCLHLIDKYKYTTTEMEGKFHNTPLSLAGIWDNPLKCHLSPTPNTTTTNGTRSDWTRDF